MNKFITHVFLLIIICLCACNNSRVDDNNIFKDTVDIAKIHLIDTTTYLLANNTESKIASNIEISYPQLYIDRDKTELLQHLFLEYVLDVSADSLSLASCFQVFANDKIEKFAEDIRELYESEYDLFIGLKPEININICPIYNKQGLIIFKKNEERIGYNANITLYNNYYTIDLNNMTKVGIEELFTEDDIPLISELLKTQLRENMNVSSNDELVELGFYNIDNLIANDNFLINDKSVTWNFNPRELSVVDEVKISLDYNKLLPYISEKSILNQFIKEK